VLVPGQVVGQQQVIGLALLIERRKVDCSQLLTRLCIEAAHAVAGNRRKWIRVDAGQGIVTGRVTFNESLQGVFLLDRCSLKLERKNANSKIESE
jgi:hypothetical protein